VSGHRRRGGIFPAFAAFGALLALIGGAAQAEARTLDLPANAGWQHAATGLVLRSRLAGYQRTWIDDSGTAELDISANFEAPDRSTVVTLYLFRPALMSVPVWFDRSETQILLRDEFHGVQPAAEARAFAPPGSTVASALRRVYVTGLDAYRTTGLAMMPMGEWLVAVRISSHDADPAALEARLDAVIAAIGWPEGATDGVPASVVADCPEPLEYARRAKLQRPSMADALLGSALLGAAAQRADDATATESAPAVLCRDAPGKVEYGVYRDTAELKRQAYLMALGDAGRTISVAPSIGALVDGSKGYMLSLGDLDRTLIFPNFDKLAPPDKALETVTSTAPISSFVRGADGGSTINISTDAVR